jgi:hypothetical protein
MELPETIGTITNAIKKYIAPPIPFTPAKAQNRPLVRCRQET